MLNQNFTPSELLKILKKGDARKYNLWKGHGKKEHSLKLYSKSISSRDYKISYIVEQKRRGKRVFTIDPKTGGVDYIAIRKVDSNLKRIYKVKQADRSSIVRQLLSIIEDGSPMYLLKLDIKSFYESINPDILIRKITTDQIISKKTERILASLFELMKEKGIQGLPRGISVSATLSEMYMRKIDREIQGFKGVYFYSRFVDDIVIICFENKEKLLKEINSHLEKHQLYLNKSKQKELFLNGDNDSFIGFFKYLGYRFEITRKVEAGILFNRISVHIADEKVLKIKKRIIKTFLDYFKSTDWPLLKNRLKFLTGNCVIDRNKNGSLIVGNHYVYKELTDTSDLKKLDSFLFSLLKNKNGAVGIKSQKVFTNAQVQKLLSYSFVRGFKNKAGKPLVFKFSYSQIQNIVRCWKYE